MRKTIIFAQHELTDYFSTIFVIGSIIAFLFAAGVMTIFVGGWLDRRVADLEPFFSWLPWLLVFLVPALSIRLWTGDREADTMDMLRNLPLTTLQAVLGKFLAAWVVTVLTVSLTFPFWISVNVLGEPDNGVILWSYAGAMAIATALLPVCLSAAAYTRKESAAYILAAALCLVLMGGGAAPVGEFLPDGVAGVVRYFSPLSHFKTAVNGVLELRGLIYFTSLLCLGLVVNVMIVRLRLPEKKRNTASRYYRASQPQDRMGKALRRLAIFVGVLVILNGFSAVALNNERWDVTEEGIHTLDPGTLNTLASIDQPITVRLYFSKIMEDQYPQLAVHYTYVRQMLEDYRALSGGMLRLEYYDPEPDSDSEKHALAFGLTPLPIGESKEPGYFGLVASNSTDNLEVLSFLDTDRHLFLEYDLTRMIDALVEPRRKVVGLLSSLPIDVSPPTVGGNGNKGAWSVIEYIRGNYTVRSLSLDIRAIPEDIDVLMLVHPKALSTETQYAVDQFVLGGGRVLAFVDPRSESEGQAGTAEGGQASDINRLLQSWGVTLNIYQVLGDQDAARPIEIEQFGRPQVVDYVAWPSFTRANISADDPVTGNLRRINTGTPGALMIAENAYAEVTPLITSGPRSMLIKAEDVEQPPKPYQLLARFKPDGHRYLVAVRFKGRIKSAFKDGLPGTDALGHLNESIGLVNGIVVADTDLLQETFWAARASQGREPGGRQKSLEPIADNMEFVMNALANLSAGSGVTPLGGWKPKARPFVDVEKILASRLSPPGDMERQLNAVLEGTMDRVRKLDRRRIESGGPGLTDKEEVMLAELPKRIEESRQRIEALPEVVREQRRREHEITSLLGWIKFWNIWATPLLLVSLVTLMVKWDRRRATG